MITSAEWQRLGKDFLELRNYVNAQYQTTRGVTTWSVSDARARALCELAGGMLRRSTGLEPTYDGGNCDLWLDFLKSRSIGNSSVSYCIEELPDGSNIPHFMGSLDDLRKVASVACIECAAAAI